MINSLTKYYGVIFLSIQMLGLLMRGFNAKGWMKKNCEKEETENKNLSHNSKSTNTLPWTIPGASWSRGIMADSETYKMYKMLPESWSTSTGALDDPFPC